MKLDLSSLCSIQQFCNDFKSRYDKIHILVNNAGVLVNARTSQVKTEDGFEIHMGVNHLGHFLLTNLLLDILKQSTPSRLVSCISVPSRLLYIYIHIFCTFYLCSWNWNIMQFVLI